MEYTCVYTRYSIWISYTILQPCLCVCSAYFVQELNMKIACCKMRTARCAFQDASCELQLASYKKTESSRAPATSTSTSPVARKPCTLIFIGNNVDAAQSNGIWYTPTPATATTAAAGSTDTDSDWNKAKPELQPTSSAHLPPLSHNNFTKIKPASSENSILFWAQLSSAWLTSGRYDNFPACSSLYSNVPHKVLHMHWRVFLFCLECVSRFEFKKLRLIRHSKIQSSISLSYQLEMHLNERMMIP